MKKRDKQENKKRQIEWLGLYVSYITVFIGSNYIIHKHASFATSLLSSDVYFRTKGNDAIIYGVIFLIFSFIGISFFLRSLLKNAAILNSIKKAIITYILLYLYIPLFNIVVAHSNFLIMLMNIVILLFLIYLVLSETYRLYKELKQNIDQNPPRKENAISR